MKERYKKYLRWLDMNKDGRIDLSDIAIMFLDFLRLTAPNMIVAGAIGLILEIIKEASYSEEKTDDLNEEELKLLNQFKGTIK